MYCLQSVLALTTLFVDFAESFPWDASPFCVHGTKVRGESRCECDQGYIGDRCDVSVCHNYCLNGDCSVTDEGYPKCRCYPGFSGERCEDAACYKYCLNNGTCILNGHSEPVCQCTGKYEGERCTDAFCVHGTKVRGKSRWECDQGYIGETCDVSVCHNYCLHGDCGVTDEGYPKCWCYPGYSGERCEDAACYQYCLNNGTCILNNDSEPVCQCTGKYEGERCADLPAPPIKVHEKLHWLTMIDNNLPPNAMTCGPQNYNDRFIARSNISGSVCPGTYVKSLGAGFIPWGGKEHTRTGAEIEILCGTKGKWVRTEPNKAPHNAFIGGHTGGTSEAFGEPLYVGRTIIDGKYVCGKAYARYNRCYFPYNGKEEIMASCEILVEADDECT